MCGRTGLQNPWMYCPIALRVWCFVHHGSVASSVFSVARTRAETAWSEQYPLRLMGAILPSLPRASRKSSLTDCRGRNETSYRMAALAGARSSSRLARCTRLGLTRMPCAHSSGVSRLARNTIAPRFALGGRSGCNRQPLARPPSPGAPSDIGSLGIDHGRRISLPGAGGARLPRHQIPEGAGRAVVCAVAHSVYDGRHNARSRPARTPGACGTSCGRCRRARRQALALRGCA